jgi:hypothetical protein
VAGPDLGQSLDDTDRLEMVKATKDIGRARSRIAAQHAEAVGNGKPGSDGVGVGDLPKSVQRSNGFDE